MNTRNIIAFLIMGASCFSCNSQNSGVKNINAIDFDIGISAKNIQLVDARTPEEYKEKHILNAKNINYESNDFGLQMGSLDKSKPTYIYCLSGARSIKAGDWAMKHGFTDVYNLDGGINAWLASDKPVVTETGAPPAEGMSFDDYLVQIKDADKLVLVDFNAVWCGPCKIIKPSVIKIANANSGKLKLLDIDVDKNPLVARSMNIQGIPLLVLYKNGKEVWRNLGVIEEKELTAQVKKFLK